MMKAGKLKAKAFATAVRRPTDASWAKRCQYERSLSPVKSPCNVSGKHIPVPQNISHPSVDSTRWWHDREPEGSLPAGCASPVPPYTR